jgi:hypothetical protein
VITYEQDLDTLLELFCDLIKAKSNQRIKPFSIYQRSTWDYEYSIVSGDRRALTLLCSDSGGYYQHPPNSIDLWVSAAGWTSRSFIKKIRKYVD